MYRQKSNCTLPFHGACLCVYIINKTRAKKPCISAFCEYATTDKTTRTTTSNQNIESNIHKYKNVNKYIYIIASQTHTHFKIIWKPCDAKKNNTYSPHVCVQQSNRKHNARPSNQNTRIFARDTQARVRKRPNHTNGNVFVVATRYFLTVLSFVTVCVCVLMTRTELRHKRFV